MKFRARAWDFWGMATMRVLKLFETRSFRIGTFLSTSAVILRSYVVLLFLQKFCITAIILTAQKNV